MSLLLGFSIAGAGELRQRLDEAKNLISFLQQEDSKVLEFWQIWSESVPLQEDVVESSIVFQVSVAADLEKVCPLQPLTNARLLCV